ncbi:Lytic transglycosylase catalytic [Neorhizobium galegae bv. orientalis]|uniref:Lytic transglycosylase catalytic n=1 Tax=Neorhizobium galegae bv. orientalis str. HAMBI 540 TaxID=1028800 RepID=A0A068SL37_NEOGA|nr:Lytic transglycosylase catalytic [Neorhizobium galegae bv. orientalis str. HAMBI 540]CDZ45037.1 Lytic transglycosylase catalytic [Neorhizobium galegae bv. orientalis]
MWRGPLLAALVLVSSTFDADAGSLFSSGGWGTQQGAAAPAAPPSRAAITRRAPVRTPAAGSSVNSGVCEREIQAAAAKYGVPEGILYSVGLTETGRKGSLSAYAMNVEGKAFFPPSQQAAMTTFYDAKRQGMKLIDIGCMQINHYFHGENFSSPEEMFDPKRNVEYAAKFLRNLHDKHETWTMAVARYHAGPNNNPAQKQYVCRVISNLVATGYGEWTSNASRFCAS